MDAPKITADDPEKRKEQLKQAAQEHRQELSAEQHSLKDEITSEHGGDLIECEVAYTANHTGTVRTRYEGELIGKLRSMTELAQQYDDVESEEVDELQAMRDIEALATDMATLLDNLFVSDELDETLFLAVYDESGPEPLAEILERVANSIADEVEGKQERAQSFRRNN